MVTVAYNAYCVISKEGDDDTYDGKTVGSRSWEVGATANSLVVTLFHVIITRTGTDIIFLSRLGSTICFTNFGSHDPIVLYWNPWYTEPCYKGSLLYCQISNISCTEKPKTLMFIVLSCGGLCAIFWSQVLSRKWRCSWSSADRWCSNYIWMINNFIAY